MFLFALKLNLNGGKFNIIICFFQKVEKAEKVRIEMEWLRKLAAKIPEEMNNKRYSFWL